MPRKQKPTGKESWTWEEIKLGHRLSKAGKRMRRMMRYSGCKEDEDGRIKAPDEDSVFYWCLLILIGVITGLVILFASS